MNSDFVDHVFVITTNKHNRINNFLNKYPFDKNNLTVIIINNNKLSQDPNYDKIIKIDDINGTMPEKVAYAHKYVCKIALGNFKKILVFEDDAELAPYYTNTMIEKVLNWIKKNNFDLYFLGHVPTNLQIIINQHTVKTLGSMESHAVCYSEKVMKLIVNKMNIIPNSKVNLLKFKNDSNDSHIDDFLRIECKFLKAYACYPIMFYQNVHPQGVLEAIQLGIFSNYPTEQWTNAVSDTVITLSQIIYIVIIMIILLVLYQSMNYLAN